MDSLLESNTLSSQDSWRLKETFFSPEPSPSQKRKKSFKKPLLAVCLSFVLGLAAILLAYNFSIIVLPRVKNFAAAETISLLAKNDAVTLELIQPQGNSQILKNLVSLDVPFNKKVGLRVNFTDAIDLSEEAHLVLLIKTPHPDFVIEAVLRDRHFFSNATYPFSVQVPGQTKRLNYERISIFLQDQTGFYPNLRQVNQLRLAFHQQNKEMFTLFIKDIFLEKRR